MRVLGSAAVALVVATGAGWEEARRTLPSSALPEVAARVRDAALARVPLDYDQVLRSDGLVSVELARRRALFASLDRERLVRSLREMAHHVTLDPRQRITDYRDDRMRVEVPPDRRLDATEAMTVSAWVRLDVEVTIPHAKIVSLSGVAGGKIALLIGPESRLGAATYLEGGQMVTAEWDAVLPVGPWSHVALTFEARRGLELRIDGGVPAEFLFSTHGETHWAPMARTPEQPLYLGGLDRSLPGLLDDVRIYDRVLTAGEVGALARGESVSRGLVGHWPLDERSGREAANRVPGGKSGRVGAEVQVGLPGTPALPGSTAFRFSRPEGYWTARLDELQARIDAEEVRLLGRSPDEPGAGVDRSAVLDALRGRGAVLLHYVADAPRDRLLIFRVDPNRARPLARHDAGSLREIAALAARVSGSARGRGDAAAESAYRVVARALGRRIWDPLAPRPGSTVLLRLDAGLEGIAFPALVDGDGRYLVDRFAFGRAGPLAGLGRPRERGRSRRAELFGNPDFAAFPGFEEQSMRPPAAVPGVRRGPGTASCLVPGRHLFASLEEIALLGELLTASGLEVRIHEWTDAYESRLGSAAEGAGILHVATHSWRLAEGCLPRMPSDPLSLTGLQLSGVSRVRPDRLRREDDGLLSALELSLLDLSSTELVAFSGCGTAWGAPGPAGERFGLPAAAWIAGAHASLAALWDVDDEAIVLDVAAFYRAWLQDGSLPRAVGRSLREALERTRRERGHGHPAYWAALVVEGL